ncbi:TonB-dependent receptor domain-containing protein [Allopontixanthobacter sp.]|uniref:TonB-dependent receptor domain-containing protein n=1 Tax=Allopontixanthobacter sp. TaxID=2906452 RepID=UPI002AB903B7|nr:TonB-dependent receptor [Allopontixanthobacter sp.]MDZ4307720.1 TonB-dependent receptor [Allopontixanthobacter sp.]
MRRSLLLAFGTSTLALCAPSLVHAQAVEIGSEDTSVEDPADTIIVTGSRIRRDPLDNPSPVISLDESALQQTGLSSVADILQRLPSASGGLNTKVNNSGNIGNPQDGGGVGAGTAEIDLRYLLAKRTLVLVDGLRYVPATAASGIPSTIDLNSIPQSMIQRIEVLQSGQSPLYGSDAIAGVVNIITKTQQDGFRGSAKYGQYLSEGDGETTEFSLSYGTSGPGISVALGFDYVDQQKVLTADRDQTQFPNPGQTSCTDPIGGCSSASRDGRIVFNPGNPSLPAGGSVTVRNSPLNTRGVFDPTLVGGDFRSFTSADRFNFAPFNLLLTPSERYGAWLSAKVEVSEDVNLRTRLIYNHRNSQNQAAFIPLFLGPDAGNGNLLDTVSIDVTNPFNPFGITLNSGANGQPATYSFIARRLVEAGQRTFNQSVDTWTMAATLDGRFELGGRNFYWDINGVLGLNDASQLFTGNVNAAKVAQALGPLANCTGSCVPLNIFGGEGSITQEMLAFIAFDERAKSDQRLQDYTANLTGELFDLPGGAVAFAVGYEHRYQKGSFTPDPIVQAGLSADIPAQAASGKFNTDEFYGELRVPLLADMPFFQQLEFDGAVRHARYSTGFSNTSFTGTVLWKPVTDLLLRGSFAEGFRAPALGELFGAQSRADAPIDDPCTNVAGSPWQTSATVRTNCIANGVPADGSFQEPTGGQLPTLTGGNSALQPETSETWLVGAVYSPDWARGGLISDLSLELNYYNITVDGAISAINPQVTLSRCAQLADPLACGNITRTASGFISSIRGLLQNIGEIKTAGIDATFNFRSGETGAGSFGLSLNGNFLDKYEETFPTDAGTATIDFRGTTRGFPDQSYPKFKGTGVLSWAMGGLDAAFTGRYIDSVEESDGKKLASRFYGDIQVSFAPRFMDEAFRFTVGVLNVFDTDPPACFSCTGPNYDPSTYDLPGQFGYVRLTYRM